MPCRAVFFHGHHCVEESEGLNFQKLITTLTKLSGHLQRAMMSYGVGCCDSYTVIRTVNVCQKAHVEADQAGTSIR